MDFSTATFVVNKGARFIIANSQPNTRKRHVQLPNSESKPLKRQKGNREKICFYQERCKRHQSSRCPFVHLPPQFFVNKKKPYKLYSYFPHCTRANCTFVHWVPEPKGIRPSSAQIHSPPRSEQRSDEVEEETNEEPLDRLSLEDLDISID